MSFKNTFSLLELGISIPIVLLPGSVATLVEIELVYLAISSAKLIIFATFIPDAGSNSYKVTNRSVANSFNFTVDIKIK